MSLESRRRAVGAVCFAVLLGNLWPVRALAQPAPPPPPRPVLGPLEYGPPAYPPGVGVPLLPPARSGVVATANDLRPTGARAAPPIGVAGVAISADALAPRPAGSTPPVQAGDPADSVTPEPLLPYSPANAGIAGVGVGADHVTPGG